MRYFAEPSTNIYRGSKTAKFGRNFFLSESPLKHSGFENSNIWETSPDLYRRSERPKFGVKIWRKFLTLRHWGTELHIENFGAVEFTRLWELAQEKFPSPVNGRLRWPGKFVGSSITQARIVKFWCNLIFGYAVVRGSGGILVKSYMADGAQLLNC